MDNKIPNMDYDADEVINEFKEKIKWPKSDEVTAIVKPSKMPLRVFISLIITAIAGGVAYYMMLPAFNIKDTQMYLFLLLLVVVFMAAFAGTAMLTVRQVGEAIVGAAEQVKGARAYGISCYNLTWREFLKIVYRAMDGIPDRKIVDCPKVFFQMFGHVMRKDYASRNVEAGIDPVGLADIMGMNLFIPTDDTKELGCTPDDIEAAIFDSIKLSKDSFEGKAKLLEMKGE